MLLGNELINGPARVNECNNGRALCRVTIARSLNCFPQRAMHFSLWSAAGVDRSPDETSLVSSFRICSPLDNPGEEIVAQSSLISRNGSFLLLLFYLETSSIKLSLNLIVIRSMCGGLLHLIYSTDFGR